MSGQILTIAGAMVREVQLDQQIIDLQANPHILAECAREAGQTVPDAGAPGEAEWYGQAAITYAACAASKATGVDFTGGN